MVNNSPKDRSNDDARRPKPRPLLNPAEVAATFSVDPKTVTRWAKSGKITHIRTPGGHRRYHADEIEKMLGGE